MNNILQKNLDRHYYPFQYRKKEKNKIIEQIKGGIIHLLLYSKLFWFFIAYLITIRLLFLKINLDVTTRSIFSLTYDPSLPQYPTFLIENMIAVLAVIFAVVISYVLTIYNSNLRKNYLNSGLYEDLSAMLLSNIDWNKVDDYALKNIRNILHILTSFPYLIKYNFRGNIKIYEINSYDYDVLPLPFDLRENIVSENVENKLTDKTKVNLIKIELFKNINSLIKKGIISDVYDSYFDFISNVTSNNKEIENDTKTTIPISLIQILYVYLIVLYCLLLISLWSIFSYFYGTIGWLILMPFSVVVTKGMQKTQNIFESPDNNTILIGNSITKLTHDTASNVKSMWELELNKNGYQIDQKDENANIIKK